MHPAPKPILCYITDRRAFREVSELRDVVCMAAGAGVDWIQIREKDLTGRDLVALGRCAVDCSRGTPTKIIVNDRLDVALSCGAAGVHLGETSLPVEAVFRGKQSAGRRDFLIGASCHGVNSAREAEQQGADYVHFGPVFATPSKAAFGEPQGIARLREVCSAVRVPVIAVGGIHLQNARECIAAGAAGVAAIRMFQERREWDAAVNCLHGLDLPKRT